MKTCIKCGVEKKASQFYKHDKIIEGRLNVCKDCVKKQTAKYRRELSGRPVSYQATTTWGGMMSEEMDLTENAKLLEERAYHGDEWAIKRLIERDVRSFTYKGEVVVLSEGWKEPLLGTLSVQHGAV